MTLRYFDAVRIDHFIGFVRYYEVPGEASTAENGRYRSGPGAHFFRTVLKALDDADAGTRRHDGAAMGRRGDAKKRFAARPWRRVAALPRSRVGGISPPPFIAEDLGTVTPEVKALRDQFHFPGMKVLQFAFGNDPEARHYQPHRYPRRCVVYTGTHDNDTTVGWFRDRGSDSSTRSARDVTRERRFALRYACSDGREIHWDLIRLAYQSRGDTVIVPMQDVLGLGSEARMNRPGVPEGNWIWRMKPGSLTRQIADRLRELAETYERI
jgi:4-alpha-glucanotransferase